MPDDPDIKRQWLAALRRKNPPKNVYVCSFHFRQKKPTIENPIPEINLGYEKKVVKRRSILVRRSDVENCAVTEPSTRGNRKRRSSSPSGSTDVSQRMRLNTDLDGPNPEAEQADVSTSSTSDVGLLLTSPDTSCAPTAEASTQWIDPTLECHDYCTPFLKQHKQEMRKQEKAEHSAKRNALKNQCQISEDKTEDLGVAASLLKTDSDAKLYTGLTLATFTMLVSYLMKHADGKILMTLMKLRLNLLYADLARRFSVSESLVSKTVTYWIDTMAVHLSKLIVWLSGAVIWATTPKSFKHFPHTTCILDCAETIMQKASNLKSHGESYSNYKSHNTVKYCVAIAPCGFIMHVSRAYGGHASDKFIVNDCKLLDRIIPGDKVMADRGFTITDELFKKRAKLNIPAFSHGKQLSSHEVTKTRRIAHVHIHVECAIWRLKVYKILKDAVPVSMTKKVDKNLRICSGLVSLGSDLIRDKVAIDD